MKFQTCRYIHSDQLQSKVAESLFLQLKKECQHLAINFLHNLRENLLKSVDLTVLDNNLPCINAGTCYKRETQHNESTTEI